MYDLQEEVDDTLKEMITNAVDAQYINSLYKEYVGYEDENAKSLLKHIKDTWCKITTLEKERALTIFRQPWDMVSTITAYERELDKAQEKCTDMGIKAPDAEKVQIYVLQMYASEMFTEIEMTDWEDKAEATKIWTEARNILAHYTRNDARTKAI